MKLGERFDRELPAISGQLYEQYKNFSDRESVLLGMAGKSRVQALIALLRSALFPGMSENFPDSGDSVEVFIAARLRDAGIELRALILAALRGSGECEDDCMARADEVTMEFLGRLPAIRDMLSLDIEAAYNGDPAARGQEEIILAYPGFEAVLVYRLAHELYLLGARRDDRQKFLHRPRHRRRHRRDLHHRRPREDVSGRDAWRAFLRPR